MKLMSESIYYMQDRLLSRMYITPVKLHNMSASSCNVYMGKDLHWMAKSTIPCFFFLKMCVSLKCLSDIVSVNIHFKGKLYILAIYLQDFKLNSRRIQPLDFGFLWTQRAIAICWKSKNTSFKKVGRRLKKKKIKQKLK